MTTSRNGTDRTDLGSRDQRRSDLVNVANSLCTPVPSAECSRVGEGKLERGDDSNFGGDHMLLERERRCTIFALQMRQLCDWPGLCRTATMQSVQNKLTF